MGSELSEDQKPKIYLSNKIEIIEKITTDKVWLLYFA